MEVDYLKIIVTISLAILGWIIGHYFTSRRDKSLKRRELTLDYMINAYRVLANDISHRKLTDGQTQKLENILSDIQLFGSLNQINLARKLADEAAKGEFQLDPLINDLRNDLRNELELKKIEGNLKWLRVTFNKS